MCFDIYVHAFNKENKTLEEYCKCSKQLIYADLCSIIHFSPFILCICFSKSSLVNIYHNYKRIQNEPTGAYIYAQRTSNSLLSAGSTIKGKN